MSLRNMETKAQKVEGRSLKLEVTSTSNLQPSSLSSRGFTIVELIVVIAILSLVATVAADAVLIFFHAKESNYGSLGALTPAGSAMQLLGSDLRAIAYGDDGSYPIVSISPSSMTFFSDIAGGNGSARVQYQLSSGTLTRALVNPAGTPPSYTGTPQTSTVATAVSNVADAVSLFRYYDKSGNEITDFSQVGAVAVVSVALDVSTSNTTQPLKFAASTTLRNVR